MMGCGECIAGVEGLEASSNFIEMGLSIKQPRVDWCKVLAMARGCISDSVPCIVPMLHLIAGKLVALIAGKYTALFGRYCVSCFKCIQGPISGIVTNF